MKTVQNWTLLFQCFLMFFITPFYAQTDSLGHSLLIEATSLKKEGAIVQAAKKIQSAVAVFQSTKNWLAWADAHEELFYTLNPSDLPLGLENFKSAEKLIKDNLEIPALAKAKILIYFAYTYHVWGDYATALKYYKKGLPQAEITQDKVTLMRYYGSAANIIWSFGDDYLAISYHEKALDLAEELRDTSRMVNITSNLANAWRTLDPAKAIPIYKKALQMVPKDPHTLMLLSKAYIEGEKDIKNALLSAQKSLNYAKENFSKSDALHQLGRVYFAKKDYDTALKYYEIALPYGEKGYGKNSPEYLKIFFFIGNAHLAKKEFQQALLAYNKTLDLLLPLFSPKNVDANPTETTLTSSNLWVLDALQGKSKVYTERFKITADFKDQEKALLVAELAVNYLQKIKSRHQEDESKYSLNDTYFSVCGLAIESAFNLAASSGNPKFIERAFGISGQNKGVVLSDALYQKEIKHLASLPDSLLRKEKKYYDEIISCEHQITHAKSVEAITLWKDSLFLAKRALNKFEKNLEDNFPAYAQAKFEPRRPASVQQIRETLPDHAALIEYFLTDRSIYTFLVSADTFWASSQKRSSHFDESIIAFSKIINNWKYVRDSSQQASNEYLKSSRFLYQYLLEKPLQFANEKRLVIVPDGILGLLPFELFLTADYEGNWTDRALPFLIKERAVSYRYSSNLIRINQTASSEKWGGFGSNFENINPSDLELIQNPPDLLALRDDGQLPFAEEEIRAIANFFGGETWLNENATRENFLENAEQFGILHLATHGIIDRKNPLRSRLLFSKSAIEDDPSVYAHEIYGMQLKAGLTVLSACNTGTGVWKKGEGIMSLARAFSFAGCPSVVMSLWNISDQSTATLMTEFYKNLKDGQAKDIALQNAKLSYLETTSPEYSKPIYWAGFVGIGDMNALPISRGNTIPKIWWLVFGVIILGGLFFLKR